MQRLKKFGLAGLALLVAAAGIAYAAGFDRLKNTVYIGAGQSATGSVVFKQGLGSDASLQSDTSGNVTLAAPVNMTLNSNGTFKLTNDGTHYLSSPTLSGNDTVAALAATQTFTNKTLGSSDTLTGSLIASFTPDGSNTLTAPSVTDTLAGVAATQTLTNKTLTSPSLTSPTVTSGNLTLNSGSNLSVGGTATISTNGGNTPFKCGLAASTVCTANTSASGQTAHCSSSSDTQIANHGIAVGGGCNAGGTTTVALVESYPITGGWVCTWESNLASLAACVVCCVEE